MQEIRDLQETETSVFLDGKYFINCVFTKCILVFAGDDYGWMDTKFIDCKIVFNGAAKRTIEVAKYFGLLIIEKGLN